MKQKKISKRLVALTLVAVSVLTVAAGGLIYFFNTKPVQAATWDQNIGPIGTTWYNYVQTNYATIGDTESNPIFISNKYELAAFARFVNTLATASTYNFENKYLLLTDDIDLYGYDWTPIGTGSAGHFFCGNFNGNNKAISNMVFANTSADSIGLF